ncbi:hypothetical protein Leryth_026967 [Lithospermum erythrorhizon]|nr:hypothetical protein Leryth_026967 [Lithospermum erythrorhizon]
MDHIAEHDAKFVSYHRIDLNHCLTGFCNLHYPTCFLNHITGFKFCLVLFFAADFMLRYATTSVCILTVELAKGNENVRVGMILSQSKAERPNGYFQDIRHPQQEVLQPAEDMPKPGLLKPASNRRTVNQASMSFLNFF